MTTICLDTSAYSHFKAGEPRSIEVISRATSVLMPVIVLGELRAGFGLGKRRRRNEEELEEFLARSPVGVLSADEETSLHYAEIFLELRSRGAPIPTNDLWIGALALQHGATVVTFDHHFDRIRQVGVILLQSPGA